MKELSTGGKFAVLMVGTVLDFISAILVGILWGWFITPAFGVVVPSLPVLFGLLITLSYLKGGDTSKLDDLDELTKAISQKIGRIVITLILAFFVSLFV